MLRLKRNYERIKKYSELIIRILDILLAPVAFLVAIYSKILRRAHFKFFPLAKTIFYKVGVFPIIDHYYDPFVNPSRLKKFLKADRNLPGIDFNVIEQLRLLDKFDFNQEILAFPVQVGDKTRKLQFCFADGPFRSGDAEYLYNMIRLFKPKTVVEVGAGSSTLMAQNAIAKNREEILGYHCRHLCIEPFENKYLDELSVDVLRKKVEDVDVSVFKSLQANDIFFIDSSHVIRPQGDVLFEYLEILPVLNSGVLVHIHDIFTPRDYLKEWIAKPRFWNEQYLLEAFLTNNKEFRIIGAVNFLMRHHYDKLVQKCPVLDRDIRNNIPREPGSFWIIKN